MNDETNAVLTNLSRIFRPLRAIRLLEMSSGLRMLIRTFFYSLPAIGNVTSLVFLFFFIYAVLGVQLYGTVQTGGALEGRAHFGDFTSSISLVFRMSTGEDWQAVMHDCAIEAPECGCICEKDYVHGAAGPSPAGFFSCNNLADQQGIEDTCGPGENAISTCGNYFSSLSYFISFFFLGAYCLMALFTAVILDCFSVVNHVDSAVVNLDCLKTFKAAWSNFDPFATGYIPLCMLQRFVSELDKPLGFDPTREKGQWRELYLQCIAMHEDLAEPDEPMRLVEFNTLIELLAVTPFGRFLADPVEHLEYKDQVRREALLSRLRQENAVNALAASWRGFRTRKSMPENIAVLRARRTVNAATKREREIAAPPPAAPDAPSRPTAKRSMVFPVRPTLGQAGAVENPLALSMDAQNFQQNNTDLLRRVSPIDGSVEWVTKGDGVNIWAEDHGMRANIQPAAPMSRDEARARQKHAKKAEAEQARATKEGETRRARHSEAKEASLGIGLTVLGIGDKMQTQPTSSSENPRGGDFI